MGKRFEPQVKRNTEMKHEAEWDTKKIAGEYLPEKAVCFPKGFSVKYFEVMPGQVYLKLKYGLGANCKCPDCGSSNIQFRGTQERETEIRDLPYFGRGLSWTVDVPELRCISCGRESFIPDFPGFLEKGERISVRLKEFAVFLAEATSCEGAARILEKMETQISGDTIVRILKKEKDSNSLVWLTAAGAVLKPVRRISEEQSWEYARSLGYYMEEEILCLNQEKRIASMAKLMEDVFVKGMVSPGWKRTGTESIWKV